MITINSKELTMENRGVSYMEQTSHLAGCLLFWRKRVGNIVTVAKMTVAALILNIEEFPIISGNFMMEMSGVWRPTSAHGGRSEELTGDYETELLEIMKEWH